MEVFTINLTLNLLLPHVVLTHVTTCNFESTDSSIMNLLHTNMPVCDSESSSQRFSSLNMIDLWWQRILQYRTWVSSKNIAGRKFERALGTKTQDLQ